MTWSRIETVNNWGKRYLLEGKRIKNGSVFRVLFPDGNVETLVCRVTQRWSSVGDMGHTTEIGDENVYFEYPLRGVIFLLNASDENILVELVSEPSLQEKRKEDYLYDLRRTYGSDAAGRRALENKEDPN